MYDAFSVQALASDVELSKLSESHRISHHHAGSAGGNATVEEEHEGITAGIGTCTHVHIHVHCTCTYTCTLYMYMYM